MDIDWTRTIKRTLVIVSTTFLIAIIILNSRGGSLSDLTAFEIIELFVAIPLTTVMYYWLISSKFEGFKMQLESITADFARLYNKLESFDKHFAKEEDTLKKEETVLRGEIKSLTKESSRLAKDVRDMKNVIKQLDKRIKKIKK